MDDAQLEPETDPGRDWPADFAWVVGLAVLAVAFFLDLGAVVFGVVCVLVVLAWLAFFRLRWGVWWTPRS